MKYISRQEEFILLTVHQLKDRAYLIEIQKNLAIITDKNWSISSVYVPLDKLERAGYLKSEIGEPTSRRGGKAIKFYTLTPQGFEALAEVKRIHNRIWENNPDLLLEK